VHPTTESRSQRREFRNEELRGRRRRRSFSCVRTREREAGEVEKGVGETQMMAFQQSEDDEEDGPEQVTLQEVRAIAAAASPVYYQPGASPVYSCSCFSFCLVSCSWT
jgi:hypothetical protein